jgi:hypothetical protein
MHSLSSSPPLSHTHMRATGKELLFNNRAHQPANIGALKSWVSGGIEVSACVVRGVRVRLVAEWGGLVIHEKEGGGSTYHHMTHDTKLILLLSHSPILSLSLSLCVYPNVHPFQWNWSPGISA